MRPLVTIGLTTFNAVHTIERALASALTQTWRPIEVVVVDDASTDGTLETLLDFARQNPDLRVFSNAVNGGVAVSRNRILAESRGEFVAFFDDDDVSLPERIAAQYRRIAQYERNFAIGAPVICHTGRRVVYPHGESRDQSTMGEAEGRRAPAGPAVARRILMGQPLEDGYGACPTCCQMARLSTYRFLGGFDPVFRRSEDTDFIVRLAEAGGHFVGIAKPLVIQRMTKTADKSLRDEYHYMRLLLKKHRAIIAHEGQYDFCCKWLELKRAWLEKRMSFTARLVILTLMHPVLTVRRLYLALPNFSLNRSFSRFHIRDKGFDKS